MTNEEAIRELKAMYEHLLPHMSIMGTEALDLAIKVLEQARPKGEWLHPYKSNVACECSVCHRQMPITNDFKYCPKCGADMRGDTE